VGRNLDTNAMSDLLQFCIQHGITTFDHADIYGGYTNESDFGAAFSRSGIKRTDIQSCINACHAKHNQKKKKA